VKQILLVFAYSHYIFMDWVHENRLGNPYRLGLVYVDKEDRVRGITDPLVLKLDGWWRHRVWNHPGFPEILNSRGRSGPLIELTPSEAYWIVKLGLLKEGVTRETMSRLRDLIRGQDLSEVR
jgi:hypothetical protein